MKSNRPKEDDSELVTSYRSLVLALTNGLAWLLASHDPKAPGYEDSSDEDRKAACENAQMLLKKIAKG